MRISDWSSDVCASDLRVWRAGKEHAMRFAYGEPEGDLAVVGEAHEVDGKKATGTEITFMPSLKTFTMTEFDFETLEHRLRALAFLNSGVTPVLTDARHVEPKTVETLYEGGLRAFVEYLVRNKQPLAGAIIHITGAQNGQAHV